MVAKLRSPHLLPGDSFGSRAALLFETPLESWQEAVGRGRGGLLSPDKLAALALALAVVFAQVAFGIGSAAAASTFNVNSTADRVDLSPGNGVCATGNLVGGAPECTLRAAVQEANALAGTDTINIPAGTYTLTRSGGDDTAAAGDLDILGSVTITGAGAGISIIDGASADGIFEIRGTASVTVNQLTMRNASGSNYSSGVHVLAGTTATLDSVVISGGTHSPAIYSSGTLHIYDSRITGNSSTFNGAGIFTAGPTTISDSLIDNNSTSANGGGIYVGGAGGVNLTNVTLSGNSASVGGGVFNEYAIGLVNVTVTLNGATQSGGLHDTGGSTTTLRNTIVAGNTGGNPDGNGSFDSLGYNIVGVVGGSTGWVGTDRTGVNPLLQALADNGGPTPTHALTLGSQAIDNGTASGAPAADQRGVTRDASPDIGAYEYVTPNSAPSADAGGPYTIAEGNDLVLNGSASSDPDGDTLTYSWDLDNDLSYGDATDVSPTVDWATLQTFGITGTGSYTVGLQVDDGNSHTDVDTASLSVIPAPVSVVINSTGGAADANAGDGDCNTGGTNSEGAAECTLRAAIEEANATAAIAMIEFDIPATDPGYSAGTWEIAPASRLPNVLASVTIDGTTQPGYAGQPIVELDGSAVTCSDQSKCDGLRLYGTDIVAGLSFASWADNQVSFSGSALDGSIKSSWLGVDATGSPAPSGGVSLWASGRNTIGGTGAGDGNVIFGGSKGLVGTDAAGVFSILGNDIWGHSGLGIDLNDDGVTMNDAGDADAGFNDLLNFPVITSAVGVGGTVYVDFDLDVPAGDYRIELFTNAAGDPTGYGEGENFVSSYAVPSHPGGSVSYSTSFAGATGDIVTATATKDLGGGSYGGTSEFSAFVVVVADTEAPVITLLGSNPQTIEAGASYVELGATATDDVEGDVSGSIVIDSSAVNTSVLGSYSVTYDVADSSGNPAVQVVRTVDVVDTTAPAITLVGSNPQTIEVGGSYTELGATASDSYDGDISGSIVIDPSAVSTSVLGSYSVTYDVADSSGNPAVQVTRTVDVVDTTVPMITLVGANPQTIEVGSAYVELGATASDNHDGDISGSIVVDASAVNTSVLGSYSVTYDVTDAEGNAAVQVTRTVDVVDTTAPVITLVGSNPQTIEVGGSYVELGATASDNVDGDISGSIVIDVSAVVTSVLGSYSVTYDVTDSSGNPAVQVTRTVDVVDTTAPVITLVGSNPQTIEVGGSYIELGATASDNVDGDISGSIVIDASAVVTSVLGSYSVTYDVTDAEGNAATQVVRTVDVVDTTPPVITLVGSNPQTIEVGGSYTELGATATDNYDGDISGSIVIDASGVNTSAVGSYPVTYNVSDGNGNAAVGVVRTVDVVDTTLPVISLVGSNPQTVEVGGSYTELGATATDNYDGVISGSIVIDASAVDTATVGLYWVTYDVSDSSGNAALQRTRTVQVVDTTAPVITLAGANPQTVEVGGSYIELGATASDNVDGDISGSIVIDASAVNTSVLGSYSVTYDVTDGSGNAAVEVVRTVDVVDTTAPVITLVGANPQTIEVGGSYTELGATATDNYDGDISGSIVIDASAVVTSVLGSYSVTYDVTDGEGNAAVQVVRTVDVVDTTLPVISLVGSNPQTIEVGSAYTELGATASDNYDGDISGSIVIDASAVDTATVGLYWVTYDVTDSNGNAALQRTRTVQVVDTTLPVITLVGANPQTIEVGSAYTELGATASDNYDGDLTGSIVIDASAVNTSVVGSYPVTYNVTDSNGNAAAEVVRTVFIEDTTAPVITLTGANPQTVEVGGSYTELGATASDNYDGDISGSIVIDASTVNTSVVGSYSVTYDVTDSNGNAAVQVVRTVDVVDTTAPVISLVGSNPQTVEVGSAYTELGATASDNYDGDISGSIVIDASAVDTATVGLYWVTYDVTDSSGNAAVQRTRTLDVVDTTAPVITLAGANPQTIEVGGSYAELGATASDNYDGDISGSIVIDASAVNTATVGSYLVSYSVVDSNGNPAAVSARWTWWIRHRL